MPAASRPGTYCSGEPSSGALCPGTVRSASLRSGAETAARRGARVAVVEPQNRFGGTATASQVCYWHSIFNLDYSRQIIAGMTDEILHRLDRRGQVDYADGPDPSWYARANPAGRAAPAPFCTDKSVRYLLAKAALYSS